MAVWLAPEQIPLVHAVAARASLSIVAAGSPVRGQTSSTAATLGAQAVDDLRAMLLTTEADLVLIAAAATFGSGPRRDDVEAIASAAQRGVRIATLEPVPASALDLNSAGWASPEVPGQGPLEAVKQVPLLRLSRTARMISDVLESFGHFRMMSVEAWSGAAEASLASQLYSSLDAVLWLMGEPETIDAAYISPAHGSGVHLLAGETLRDLHGEMSLNLRFADGRAASLVLGDQGGRWDRSLTLVGASGRLHLTDNGFAWIGRGGERVDESPAQGGDAMDGGEHGVAGIAEALSRLIEGTAESTRVDPAAVLTTCQAALLSARTGQAESPATIRRMASVV
jgi:hypothetical protein